MSTYVISDIHGQKNLFDHVLKQANVTANDHVYILGDVIDRGFDGIALLQAIHQAPNMTLLLGNHEYMMLNAINCNGEITNKYDFLLWTDYNGGQVTYCDFLKLDAEHRIALYNMLQDCPITLKVEINQHVYYLTHACPNIPSTNADYLRNSYRELHDDVILPRLVWCSPYRSSEDEDTRVSQRIYPTVDQTPDTNIALPATTICGHVRVQKMNPYAERLTFYQDPSAPIIDIDGGCACWDETSDMYGVILLRLDDMQTFCYTFEDEYMSGALSTIERYIQDDI